MTARQSERIENHLASTLERLFDAPGLSEVSDSISRYVLAGGKRIRPQLCMWTWEKIGACPPSEGDATCRQILNLACAWELFHAFLLVHDDIIDGADTRRGRPALHKQLASLDHNCPRFGSNLAIVAGDLLFGAAMRLWHELDVPDAVYRKQLQLISRVTCMTGFGQAIDIMQSQVPPDEVREESLVREYLWKTAAYTFEGPMLSGAILAGADDASLTLIGRFAMAVGEAYQLQNDLLDLAVPAHAGCDLIEGKRTITLNRARTAMTPPRRRLFDERLRSLANANGRAVEIAEGLRQEVLSTPAVSSTRARIDDLLADADDISLDFALPISFRLALHDLLEGLRGTYFFHPHPPALMNAQA